MKHKIHAFTIIRRSIILICAVFCFSALLACSEDISADRTLTDIFAPNVSVVYDGRQHSISVANTISTDSVMYSTDNGATYSGSSPSFKDVGTYTVHYKVIRAGYSEFSSSATVTITPCILSDISAEDISIVYDGQPHSIVIDGVLSTDTVTYSTDGLTFSDTVPSFTEVGARTVYYRVNRPYGEYKSSCTVTILPNIYGRYYNSSFGIIVLSRSSATINGSSFPLSTSLSGDGFIGANPFTVVDGILTYNDLSFTLLPDTDYIYKLSISDSSVYFKSGETGSLSISFSDSTANIMLGEETLISVDDTNFCDSGVITDYVNLRFEQTFEHSVDATRVTDITVSLSARGVNPITYDCNFITYDGLPHGFDFSEQVVYLDYDQPPLFTEIGRHTVSVVIVSDIYLPRILDCSIVIMPDISGVYVSDTHAIQISDEVMYIDGIMCGELSIIEDGWVYNGLPITTTVGGIVYNGVTYSATTDAVLVVYLDDVAYSVIQVPQDIERIDITHDGSLIIFKNKNTVLLSVTVDSDDFVIMLDDVTLTHIGSSYVLGHADLTRTVVILKIISTAESDKAD